jgi:hypothetical protein
LTQDEFLVFQNGFALFFPQLKLMLINRLELMSMKVWAPFHSSFGVIIVSLKEVHVRPVRLFEEKRYQELMEEQHYLGNSGRG